MLNPVEFCDVRHSVETQSSWKVFSSFLATSLWKERKAPETSFCLTNLLKFIGNLIRESLWDLPAQWDCWSPLILKSSLQSHSYTQHPLTAEFICMAFLPSVHCCSYTLNTPRSELPLPRLWNGNITPPVIVRIAQKGGILYFIKRHEPDLFFHLQKRTWSTGPLRPPCSSSFSSAPHHMKDFFCYVQTCVLFMCFIPWTFRVQPLTRKAKSNLKSRTIHVMVGPKACE